MSEHVLIQILQDKPLEERLEGGLDPLEVAKSLPPNVAACWDSNDKEKLKLALAELEPSTAQEIMQTCVKCGLWAGSIEELFSSSS